MADDNTIIEGAVKFRDGKKWKSRWCVARRLSPVADCVQLQVYRDARARRAGAVGKASLSLQRYLGCESGFTLDKQSHTLALVCEDFTAVLALETRERLMQWQVKLEGALRGARRWPVVVATGGRLPAGPARLLLRAHTAGLAAGVPPKLLAVWDLSHLRRFGVVEGKFCLEGGSLCGRGEGLHVLVTEHAAEIARDFDRASMGDVSPGRRFAASKRSGGKSGSPRAPRPFRADARLADLHTIERSLPPLDLRLYEDPSIEETDVLSPYWPSAERTTYQDMGLGDTSSVHESAERACAAPWGGAGGVTLERCMSCISKLGALSRSSTAALTPGAKHFSPAWTMDTFDENLQSDPADATRHCETPDVNKTEEQCCCAEGPPARPPKPTTLELELASCPTTPRPARSRSCSQLPAAAGGGPYDNYDVPKVPSAEADGEYYDTPKRLKECINRELFKITRSSTAHTLVLKKPCGCLLKLGQKSKEPTIIDHEENLQPTSCPCARVTDWAHAWIRLPYCSRTSAPGGKALGGNAPPKDEDTRDDRAALYATVDLARKTRRKSQALAAPAHQSGGTDVDDGPLANYENLNFALSLENYENAKDLLRKVGITESELDAIGATLKPSKFAATCNTKICFACGHRRDARRPAPARNDEYLLMEPSGLDRDRSLAAGYTPMSPVGSFAFHTLKYPAKSAVSRLLEEKSASNPALCAEGGAGGSSGVVGRRARGRSSSADSSRFLEDVQEFEGSAGGSAASLETLRAAGAAGAAAPGGARDSCSSNDSGVASWPLRAPAAPPAPQPAHAPPGADARSTSSGTSDTSDYVETLSLCSSQSSSDTPLGPCPRRAASTLRPRAGPEYRPLAARR
ncbi:uncharacterized protein [Battus philenor]|uniref:uncharacterized protein n=1 Tax=Battus philenor TaxID=42288 RepID=UPI0035CFBEB6